MVYGTASCSCSVVASLLSDAVPALLCVPTPVMRAAVCLLCVGLSDVVLLFCMCVPRGIQSRFAVALLLLSLAVCTCMASLSSRCDLRDLRCVAGLSSGMTAVGCPRSCRLGLADTSCCC